MPKGLYQQVVNETWLIFREEYNFTFGFVDDFLKPRYGLTVTEMMKEGFKGDTPEDKPANLVLPEEFL